MSSYYIAKWFGLKGSCILSSTDLVLISKIEKKDDVQLRERMAFQNKTCRGIKRAEKAHCHCYIFHISQHVVPIMCSRLLC